MKMKAAPSLAETVPQGGTVRSCAGSAIDAACRGDQMARPVPIAS